MRKSDINISVSLDDEHIPEKIHWDADESPTGKREEAKAINLSIWDAAEGNTLRIDLWTKEMTVFEMKKFYIDILGGMSVSIKNATDDEEFANELDALCEKHAKKLKEENNL